MKAVFAVCCLSLLLSCGVKQPSPNTATADSLVKKEAATPQNEDPCSSNPEKPRKLSLEEAVHLSDSIEAEKPALSKTTADIPKQVQCWLNAINGRRFTIAGTGQPWQCCCDRSDTSLPDRQLIALAQSPHYFLITFNTGGIAVSSHLLLIHSIDGKPLAYWEQDAYGQDLATIAGMLHVLKTRR